MPEYVLYLVDVLCKSVGVPLAGAHVGGAGALSLDPAEVVPATLLSEADRGRLSDGDLAWLQLHGPSQEEKRSIDNWHSFLLNVKREQTQHCASVPVLADPRDMLVGFPGGHGCCIPEWGKSLVETCGLVACWVGWVLTGVLSGTKTAAVGLTGHSEKKRQRVKMLGQVCPSEKLLKVTKTVFPVYHRDLVPQDPRSPVQGWELHVGEVADFLSGYWKAGADELPLSGGRRTVELQEIFF